MAIFIYEFSPKQVSNKIQKITKLFLKQSNILTFNVWQRYDKYINLT